MCDEMRGEIQARCLLFRACYFLNCVFHIVRCHALIFSLELLTAYYPLDIMFSSEPCDSSFDNIRFQNLDSHSQMCQHIFRHVPVSKFVNHLVFTYFPARPCQKFVNHLVRIFQKHMCCLRCRQWTLASAISNPTRKCTCRPTPLP